MGVGSGSFGGRGTRGSGPSLSHILHCLQHIALNYIEYSSQWPTSCHYGQ